ncbi:MAG: MOP flippase family protein [Marinobacter sp.]|uniref:MOP flippase family protein n=1 Tax=Marinobacter sp. TaxID=50741 RepID=UPI0034A07C66
MTLKHRTFSAVRWTTAAAVVRALVQLAQLAVLARLLVPEDYGLMAMVAVVLGFATVFTDMGVNSAYVQRQDVTPEQRSSLFWLNASFGGGLTLLVLFCSSFIAGFFGDERLTPLLMLASITFVVIALGQQVKMTAEKTLDFRPVALIEITAALVGFFAAVIAAYSGWGVYALILGAIVNATAVTVMAWLFLARGWRPMWRFQYSDVRSFLGFGGALVGNNIVNEFNRSIDLLLGGRMLAASALGLYSLPRQVVFQIQGLVNPIITRVGFPLIAQVQGDIPKVRSIYLKTLNMTAATNAPLYLGIAFFAPEVVTIMLGEKWLAATDLLRLLAIWGFLRSTGNPVGSLLLGMGRADLELKWNLAMLCLVPPLLWMGSHYGTLGLAWSLLGFTVVMFIPGWYVLVRPICKAGLLEYSIATLRPLLIAVMAIAPAHYLTLAMTNVYLHMIVAVLISAPLYMGLSFLLNREWLVAMRQLASPGRTPKNNTV